MRSTKKQFVRFAAGGAVGTAAHYAVLILLVEWLLVPPPLGTLVGFAVGAMVNYMIARRYVFGSRRPHRTAVPRFVGFAIAGAVMNTGMVAFLVAAGFHYLLAQVFATVTVLIVNFLVNKHWTFDVS